jgi:hypothetical protein
VKGLGAGGVVVEDDHLEPIAAIAAARTPKRLWLPRREGRVGGHDLRAAVTGGIKGLELAGFEHWQGKRASRHGTIVP